MTENDLNCVSESDLAPLIAPDRQEVGLVGYLFAILGSGDLAEHIAL